MLLFYVVSTLSNWGSIEVQDQIRKVLADDRLNTAGLNLTDVMGWLRWALMGAAALATAGIVFAIYTALGHQASRVILTILCGLGSLVFLAGGLFGILPAAFSIGCGIYLWTPDARQWFAVKNGKASIPEVAASPPRDPFDTAVAPPVLEAPGPESPPVSAPQQAVISATRAPIPKPVLIAGLIALIMSSLVAVGAGIGALAYAVAGNEMVRLLLLTEDPTLKEQVREFGLSPADLVRGVVIVCTVLTIVALAAVAAAGATLAGKRAGRTLLVILTILTLPITFAAFPFGVMWTAGAIATLVLLKRPESRSWFARP